MMMPASLRAWFRRLRLERKMMVLATATNALVICATATAFVVHERATLQHETRGKLELLADVIGNNAAPSILFDDPKVATQMLEGLAPNGHIVSARIVRPDGSVFAQFHRDPVTAGGDLAAVVTPTGAEAATGGDAMIEVSRPIAFDRESVGTVIITSDTRQLSEAIAWLVVVMGAIAVTVLALSVYVSAKLQILVSRPILHLVDAMRLVSDKRDYGTRVQPEPEDELGALAVGFNDMLSKIEEQQERLAVLAHFDSLTSLPNRALFRDRLDKAIRLAERTEAPLAVIFIDLDAFKDVNDSHGHRVGDQLLLHVARCLSGSIRDSDTLARLGGDEFVVIAQNLSLSTSVIGLVNRMVASLKGPCVIDGLDLMITASIGVALYPQDGRTDEELLRSADAAMYQAKKEGKDGFRFYSSDLHGEACQRLTMVGDLRRALERDELLLHYQPQIDVRSDEIVGLEALVRWQHPTSGLLAPGVFIPVAEESGIIEALGEWVFRRACREVKVWKEQGLLPPRVSVNISTRQIRRGRLIGVVRSVMEQEGVTGADFELEVTESSLMLDVDEAIEVLRELRAMGFTIAIDDLGTGYSSLSQLRRLPADRVKIDRSFLVNVPGDVTTEAILYALIDVANSLNLAVTAEGVETQEQLALLLRAGCHEMQGYLLGRPASTGDTLARLARARLTVPSGVDASTGLVA